MSQLAFGSNGLYRCIITLVFQSLGHLLGVVLVLEVIDFSGRLNTSQWSEHHYNVLLRLLSHLMVSFYSLKNLSNFS